VIGGQSYRLAPMTVGHIAKLARYIKDAPVRDVARTLKDAELPKDMMGEQLRAAYAEIKADTRSVEELVKAAKDDFDAMLYLAGLRLPELKIREVAADDAEALAQAMGADITDEDGAPGDDAGPLT